ncbi:EP1-like glycoprotein 4 [Citrus sinensis]|nr:EP1-like glycoprotein 4 [Citrus sinensis]
MSGIYNDLFNLGFYNTTPNAYTLALLFGSMDRKTVFRWVWEANRGKPVRANAVLSFGTDGNLVLAEADGTVVWQSNTANKGVVRFELLSSGNMVLRDSKGKFIWQSFDYPTDTLLVGQSLRVSRVTKLISRLSIKENVDGPHSFVMEPKRLALYYKSSNAPRPLVYYTFPISYKGLKNLTLKSSPETMYKLTLDSSDGNSLVLDRPKYDSTISFLRLSMDGNLRVFTFPREVDWLPEEGRFWLPEEERFTLFGKDSRGSNAINWENECQMPDKCGELGLCEDNQCIACPTEKGLIGWNIMMELNPLQLKIVPDNVVRTADVWPISMIRICRDVGLLST